MERDGCVSGEIFLPGETSFTLQLPIESKKRKVLFYVTNGFGDYTYSERNLLDITASLLKSNSPKEFIEKEGFNKILVDYVMTEKGLEKKVMQNNIVECLGPPIEIAGKTVEECYQAEIQAIKQAIILWLQAPINKKAPFLDKDIPEKYHREHYNLSPRERFLLFSLNIAFQAKASRREIFIPQNDVWLRPFGQLIPESRWFLEECYLKRQKEYSTEIVPVQEILFENLKEWFPKYKGTPIVLKDLFYIKGSKRFLAYRYSSRWVLPLVWAEILYCVQNNIPAQFCKTCGSLFVAESPTQDYRQVYCSPECRKKAKKNDPSQEKEAQRLYKAFLRGKINAEEYVKLARKKGLRVIGEKHKDSKLLKNSST